MNALASLGSSAKGATTALVNSLDDKDAAVQLSAIRAIGKLESDDSALAERLVKFLDGANEETRLAVVVSLGGFRKLPDSAVNSLVGSTRGGTRRDTVRCLWRTGQARLIRQTGTACLEHSTEP